MPIIMLGHRGLLRTPYNQNNVHFRTKYATSLEFNEGGVGKLSIT